MDIVSNIPLLQDINPRLVLSHIRASGSICRADIARKTGLHPSTITRIVASLIKEGLVQEDGEGHNEVGRKPIMLSLVPDAVHVIGIAIESTFISGVVVNLNAEIIENIVIRFDNTAAESITRKLEIVIDELMSRVESRGIEVAGIGVAMHGIIDSNRGICLFAPAIGTKNMPVGAIINEKYELPVRINNNANAMVLGESWFGNGRGVDNLFAVKIGESIGSGIILNGKLFPGADFAAGEIGHTTVVFDGLLCKCGNYGCLETVASIGAVVKKGRLLLKRGEGRRLLELVGSNPDSLNFRNLCDAAKLGDKLALQLWEEAGSYLGLALANAINILNPTRVLIGGDILPAMEFILPKLREIVAAKIFKTLKTNIYIEEVGLGSEAVAIGAATLVLKEIFEL